MTRVVDGDTLKVRFRNGTIDTVRLIGVDTPEIHSENTPDEFEGVPDTEAGRACLRRYGDRASTHVTELLDGEQIHLKFDDRTDRRGYYGRLLAYVYYEGANLNYDLVAGGWARVYDSEFEQEGRFYDAEDRAQMSLRRVWSCREVSTLTPTPTPTEPTGDGGSLAVAAVHEDAAGNDHENENNEYVVFENTGDSTLDISGWIIEDEADHTYTVPDGVSVDAGATITLYTGSGTDTTTALYWGSDAAIWNNAGDTIYVRDESGTLVIEYSY